jgi:hypothetical protein
MPPTRDNLAGNEDGDPDGNGHGEGNGDGDRNAGGHALTLAPPAVR